MMPHSTTDTPARALPDRPATSPGDALVSGPEIERSGGQVPLSVSSSRMLALKLLALAWSTWPLDMAGQPLTGKAGDGLNYSPTAESGAPATAHRPQSSGPGTAIEEGQSLDNGNRDPIQQ